MLMLQIIAAILWMIAIAVALVGSLGFYSLLVLDDFHMAVRFGAWVVSLVVLAALIAVPYENRWGPFAPGSGCSRSRPCYQVQMPVMPTPAITLRVDLPGTPTAEDCNAEVARFKTANKFSVTTVVVGECS